MMWSVVALKFYYEPEDIHHENLLTETFRVLLFNSKQEALDNLELIGRDIVKTEFAEHIDVYTKTHGEQLSIYSIKKLVLHGFLYNQSKTCYSEITRLVIIQVDAASYNRTLNPIKDYRTYDSVVVTESAD